MKRCNPFITGYFGERQIEEENECLFEKTTPLHLVVYKNRPDFIDYVVNNLDIDVNSVDAEGNTPLHAASALGFKDCVEKLIGLGAEPMAYNKSGVIPFFSALRNRQLNIATFLLEECRREMLAAIDLHGYSVLHYAVILNSTSFLNKLNEMWCVNDLVNNNCNDGVSTPLHIASRYGSDESIKWLLRHNATISIENEMGEIPLIVAIKHCQSNAINILLPLSPINIPDNYGQLPIHHAACIGDLKLINRLIGMDQTCLNKADTNGNYPFHCSLKSGDIEIVKFFYPNKQYLTKANSNGMTPLMLSMACGCEEVFNYLVGQGASLQTKTFSGTTPFLCAVSHGKLEMAKKLFLADPSFINDRDNNSNTIFHHAVQNGHIRFVEWFHKIANRLLERPNYVGETPLHIACLIGDLKMVKLLVETYHHSLECYTYLQRSPVHYAVLGGHYDVVEYIIEKAPLNTCKPDKNKLNFLHYCCCKGYIYLLSLLIHKFPYFINGKDGCGRTPLHVAVIKNDVLCVEMLIESGCDCNQKDIRGLTPSDSAINRGFIHCYNLIGKVPKERWTTIKKVEVTREYSKFECDKLLPLMMGMCINVVWTHPSGWAIGIDEENLVGLFIIDNCKVVELSGAEREQIQSMLKKKKFVKKDFDKKNRSLSVAVPGHIVNPPIDIDLTQSK